LFGKTTLSLHFVTFALLWKYIAPFLITGAAAGAWLVWPALTPEFKGRWGLGPKVEE